MIRRSIIISLGIFFFCRIYPNLAVAQNSCDLIVGQSESFKTVNEAINSLGDNKAGKTICIKNDKEYGSVLINNGGNSNNKLVIKGHPNNSTNPKFVTTQDESALQINASNVSIENISVNGSNGAGFSINNNSNVSLINIQVSNTRKSGIEVQNSSDITIDGCELSNLTPGSEGRYNNLHIFNNSSRVIVQNCLIYEDLGKGGYSLGFDNASEVIFRNNELFSNSQPNIFLGNGENIIIENNLVSATCVNPQAGEDAVGTGIYRFLSDSSQQTNPKFKGSKVKIRNNLLVNLSKGIKLDGCKNLANYPGENCPFSEFEITNNTVVGIGMVESKDENAEYALWAYLNEGTTVDAKIENNIFHTKNGSESDYMPTQFSNGVRFSNNLWSDLTKLPQNGNELITNWAEVFSENPNLSTCTNERINPSKYKTTTSKSDVGADVSKVGIGKVDGVDFPTPTTSPIVTVTEPGPQCRSKNHSFISGAGTVGDIVKYTIKLDNLDENQENVRLVDEISAKLELTTVPDYCEIIEGNVLGVETQVINTRVIIALIVLSIVFILIILNNNKSGKFKVTVGLTTVALISVFFFIKYFDFAPSNVPASTIKTLRCDLSASDDEITYEAEIIGVIGEEIKNEAKIFLDEELVDTCTTSFEIADSTNPTIIPTHSVTPTFSTTVTPPINNICGKADVDDDGVFRISDFTAFASAYKTGNIICEESYFDYGPCGGRDANRDGLLNIADFGGSNIGFAQRYYPKTSCALD